MIRWLYGLLLVGPLLAQQAQPVLPDCIININFYGDANQTTADFNNTFVGCDTWTFTYSTNGNYSGLTLTLQSAASGTTSPGSFTSYTGTTVTGSNPLTGTSSGAATFTNITTMATVATPWLNVALTGASSGNTGQVYGVVYGYRTGYNSGNGGGGGSGCSTPCPVVGPTAIGNPPTTPPVFTAGFDGTNLRALATDTSGNQQMIGPAAQGAAASGNPVRVAGWDGTDVRTLATDTSGNQKMIGPTAAGSAPITPPVLVAGSDGTDLRTFKTDTSGDVAEFQIGLGTFNTNQQAVTASAVALATNASKTVCVKALIGNTINVYVGPSGVTTSTGFELSPGQPACWNVSNSNLLYVIAGTTGASVAWSLTN